MPVRSLTRTPVGELPDLRLKNSWKKLKHKTYKVDAEKCCLQTIPDPTPEGRQYLVIPHSIILSTASKDGEGARGVRLMRKCKMVALKEKVHTEDYTQRICALKKDNILNGNKPGNKNSFIGRRRTLLRSQPARRSFRKNSGASGPGTRSRAVIRPSPNGLVTENVSEEATGPEPEQSATSRVRKRKRVSFEKMAPLSPQQSDIRSISLRCSECEKLCHSEASLTVHEEKCIQRICAMTKDDIRIGNKPSVKKSGFPQESFMNQFGMLPSSKGSSSSACNKDRGAPYLRRRALTRSQPVGTYFQKNYLVSVSGIRGQALIRQSSNGIVTDVEAAAKAVDVALAKKDTVRVSNRIRRVKRIDSRVTKNDGSEKAVKNAYTHTYQFTRKQKIKRDTELVVGLKTKQFSLLNKCRDLQLRLTRVPDTEIEKMRAKKRQSNTGLPKRMKFTLKKVEIILCDLADTASGRALLAGAARGKREAELAYSSQLKRMKVK